MITSRAYRVRTGSLFKFWESGASPIKFCTSFVKVEVFDDSFQDEDESRRTFATASDLIGDIALASLLGAESSNYCCITVDAHRYPELCFLMRIVTLKWRLNRCKSLTLIKFWRSRFNILTFEICFLYFLISCALLINMR